jgi:GNAT superfamily N-acetyltransferase
VAQTVVVQIRPRRATDLPQCVDVLAELHRVDAYPQRWPVDPAIWLNPSDSLAAWVADGDGAILGHVVVTACRDDLGLAQTTGRPISKLARVSRLFVTPAAQGSGLARDLLAQAGSFAAQAGFGLVLDVVDDSEHAIAVYEHLGWRLVEVRRAVWTTVDGRHPLLRLYILS